MVRQEMRHPASAALRESFKDLLELHVIKSVIFDIMTRPGSPLAQGFSIASLTEVVHCSQSQRLAKFRVAHQV